MFFKHLLIGLTTLFLLQSFVSCGDLKKDDASSSTSQRQLQNGDIPECSLETDELSLIFEQRIEKSIECLGDNLLFFIKVTDTSQPRSRERVLSRSKLEAFIKDNIEGDKSELIKALNVAFDLVHLLFGDELGELSESNLESLISFMQTFNEDIIKVSPSIGRGENYTFARHRFERDQVLSVGKRLARNLLKLFKKTERKNDKIDLNQFLNYFVTESNAESIERIKSLLFVKTMVLGDNPLLLTAFELQELLSKLPKILRLAYDLMKFDQIEYQEKIHFYEMLAEDLDLLRNQKLLHYEPKDEVDLFSVEALLKVFSLFPDLIPFQLENYPNDIERLKEILLYPGAMFTSKDIDRLIAHAEYLVEQARYFHQMFLNEENRKLLLSSEKIYMNFGPVPFAPLSSSENSVASSDDYLKRFNRIIHDYRYFKGEWSLPIFDKSYVEKTSQNGKEVWREAGIFRNAEGVAEIGLLEYALEILFDYFEKTYPCDDTALYDGNQCPNKGKEDYARTVVLAQLTKFIQEFKGFFVSEKIVDPGRESVAADNVALLASFFQNQSNNNGKVDIPEVVEFGLAVFSSLSVREDLFSYLHSVCAPLGKSTFLRGEEAIEHSCFFQFFFPALEAIVRDKGQGDHLPQLRKYLSLNGSDSAEREKNFLIKIENFARTCPYDPLTKKDIFIVLTAILNVESTVLRYDDDYLPKTYSQNELKTIVHRLEKGELDRAYEEVFEEAIRGIVASTGKDDLSDFLYKWIYYYLLEKQEVPDLEANWKAFEWIKNAKFFVDAFVNRLKAKNITAERETIAGILSAVVESNENSEENSKLPPPVNACIYSVPQYP